MAPFLAARFTLGTAPCFPDGGFHPLCRLSSRRGQSPGRFALFWTDQKQQYGKARYKIFPFLLAWGRVASLHLSNISSDASGCERVCEARMGKEMKTLFFFFSLGPAQQQKDREGKRASCQQDLREEDLQALGEKEQTEDS